MDSGVGEGKAIRRFFRGGNPRGHAGREPKPLDRLGGATHHRSRAQAEEKHSGGARIDGGGLDLGRKRFAFRLVQADWMITRFNGFTDKNNARVSTGVLYRF